MDVVAPKVGLMEEMAVVQWLKAVGDRVTAGESLVVIETEKANVEMEAPTTGRLTKIFANGGTAIVPGQVLAEIEPE